MCNLLLMIICINRLSPKIDEHQFSPNNIHTSSRKKVMRINKMITKRKMFLITCQILSTYSLRKSIEVSLENCKRILRIVSGFWDLRVCP